MASDFDQSTVAAAGFGDPFAQRLSALDSQRVGVEKEDAVLAGQKQALGAEGERLIKARGEALKPAREKLIEKAAAAPAATTPEEPIPQYQRPTMKPQELNEAFGMMMAASMLVGAGSRTPFYGVMNAMTGAMTGFVKQDHAAVEESLKIFDKDMASIKERNAQLHRRTEDAYKTWERDFKAGKQEYELIAAEYDDPIALNLAREGKIDAARKQLESRLRSIDGATTKLETQRAQIQDRREGRDQAHADRMAIASMAHQDRVAALAQKGGGAGAGTNTGGLSADFQNNPEYAKQVDFWAQYMKDGNPLPPRFAQSGAGKKMFSDIVSRVPQLGTGDPREIQANAVDLVGQKSQSRALGTRAAAIEQAASEAREMSSIVLDTSQKFPRYDTRMINKALAAWETQTGGTEIRQFGASVNSYINAYARAVNPSGVATVADKEHAREMLSTADSHQQVKAIISVLDREMTAAQHSPQNVRKQLREQITGRRADDPKPEASPATGGDLRAKVEAAGGKYEPEKFDYRVTPDGKVQRKAK